MRFLLLICLSFIFNVSFAQDAMHDVCPLKVGEELPDVNLAEANNDIIGIRELSTNKPSVFIFYRGAWCGYCTKHLAELNEIKSEVEELGFQFLGVTMDEPSKLAESTKRSESEIKVYSDSKAEVIRAFGLDWTVGDEKYQQYIDDYKLDLEAWSGEKHHALPVPAIFVVKDGIVVFQYVNPNYRTRLKAETLLAVLKTL